MLHHSVDASYFTYNTFISHVKARLDSNVQCIDIRIGSDDEGGLTKAFDNVFPNATRLLCSKHIKDNVTDHIKNKLRITKDQRSDIMFNLFGDNDIINTDVTSPENTYPRGKHREIKVHRSSSCDVLYI